MVSTTPSHQKANKSCDLAQTVFINRLAQSDLSCQDAMLKGKEM